MIPRRRRLLLRSTAIASGVVPGGAWKADSTVVKADSTTYKADAN